MWSRWTTDRLWVCVEDLGRRLGIHNSPFADMESHPLVLLRRDLSATLLRAAHDVRWGRPAAAVAELQSAAAMLDPRFAKDHLTLFPLPRYHWSVLQALDEVPRSSPVTATSPTSKTKETNKQRQNLQYSVHHRQKFLLELREQHSQTAFKQIGYLNSPTRQSENRLQNDDNKDINEEMWSELDEVAGNFSVEGLPDSQLSSLVTNLPTDVISDVDGWSEQIFTPKAMSSLVTLLLDSCAVPLDVTEQLVGQLKILYPYLDLKVAVTKQVPAKYTERLQLRHGSGIEILKVVCTGSGGQISALVEGVTSPFVLFLESIVAVTSGDLPIRRLLATASFVQGAAVIGMAERGTDGAWDYTCTQLDIHNAQLRLQHGYMFSRASCLFCDVTSSSFLAATWILKGTVPDNSLPEPSRKLDWSLRLQRQGVLVMTCPDLMVHSHRQVRVHYVPPPLQKPCVTKRDRIEARDQHMYLKRQYRRLARKWELTSIVLDNNTRLEFSCLEIHFNCQAVSRVRYYMLPNCCLKIKNKMLETLDFVAKKENVPYEVNSGSLLGAVKFKNAIPWDFDDDAVYKNSDMKLFQKNKQMMRQQGLSPVYKKEMDNTNKSYHHNYFAMTGRGGFSMDLWGVDQLASEADHSELRKFPGNLMCFQSDHTPIKIMNIFLQQKPEQSNNAFSNDGKETKLQNFSTQFDSYDKDKKAQQQNLSKCYLQSLVRIGTNWFPAPWNPGQTARLKYGPKLYQHELHWRMKGNGRWMDCPRPGHPTCLDIHPMDGSLPFM